MIFYIADTHFGHENILQMDSRPFASVEEMDTALIKNWNARVSAHDTVYVLGDALWGKESRCIKIMEQLHGHKHLIQGNHDKVNGRLGMLWESIKSYDEIRDGDKLVVLSHYPIMFYKAQKFGSVMLYGHVHQTGWWHSIQRWQKEQHDMGIPSQLINVGCMMEYMAYTPRTLDELLLAVKEGREVYGHIQIYQFS